MWDTFSPNPAQPEPKCGDQAGAISLNQLCEHFEQCLQHRLVQTKLSSQMGIEPVEHSERENLQLREGCTVEALIERHQTIAMQSCMRTD